MIFSKRIYFITLIHILLILATSGVGLWLLLSQRGYIVGVVLILSSLFQIGALTRHLNKFNHKIRLFLDAIQDRDNMLYFPSQGVHKDQGQLNNALNRINNIFLQSKKENLKQEHFYRSLLEQVASGVVAWNTSGDIIIANSTALSLLGSERIANYMQLEKLLEDKKNLSLSQSQMKLDGEILSLLSIQDIGDELSDKESESWTNLTSVLTHEIMNTIAPVASLSQTLLKYPDGNEKRGRGLHIIHAQSQRLMEFTESFRHLSNLPHLLKKRFSLTCQLQNLGELLRSDCENNAITFTIQAIPSSIEIEGDESQLSQVFLNLLRNAMQALEGRSGGAIIIYVQQLLERVSIEIMDNGSGIPPELQEKIFIPFFTTKSEGTGIGLSLSKQIVRQHGGRISLKESLLGQTVFKIDLPV